MLGSAELTRSELNTIEKMMRIAGDAELRREYCSCWIVSDLKTVFYIFFESIGFFLTDSVLLPRATIDEQTDYHHQ